MEVPRKGSIEKPKDTNVDGENQSISSKQNRYRSGSTLEKPRSKKKNKVMQKTFLEDAYYILKINLIIVGLFIICIKKLQDKERKNHLILLE